jgi:hypothetical protein
MPFGVIGFDLAENLNHLENFNMNVFEYCHTDREGISVFKGKLSGKDVVGGPHPLGLA